MKPLKVVFEYTDRKHGAVGVPVEIRRIDEDTVVILTRIKGAFKLEHNYPAVATEVFKQMLNDRDRERIRWVMFLPDWIDKNTGGSFLIQPGAPGTGTMDAFGLCEGMLPEKAIPMPRDGSACTNILYIG